MSEFPRMIYRDGSMAVFDGNSVDYRIVANEAELSQALSDGWRSGIEKNDAAPVARRGRRPKSE